MVKFADVEKRFFKDAFVCRRCKTRMRAPTLKIIQGKVSCRSCSGRALRPVRKK